jgi:hypothetical protein
VAGKGAYSHRSARPATLDSLIGVTCSQCVRWLLFIRCLLCLVVLLLLLIRLFGSVWLLVRARLIVLFGLAIGRSPVGWLRLCLVRMLRRGILRLVLVRLLVTGFAFAVVPLSRLVGSITLVPGLVPYLALRLVGCCLWVLLLAVVGRLLVFRFLGASPLFL